MATIRRLREDEWLELRAFRIRALADAPDAFAFTLAEAERRSEDEWREIARLGSGSDRQIVFVVDEDARLIGMASGSLVDRAHLPPEDPTIVALHQMWVEPSARRKGVGTRLVEAVLEWASMRGAASVRLGVNVAAKGAIAFYERCGFRVTGKREAVFPNHRIVAISGEAPAECRFVAVEMEARLVPGPRRGEGA